MFSRLITKSYRGQLYTSAICDTAQPQTYATMPATKYIRIHHLKFIWFFCSFTLSALCSFCMAFTHCVLNFNPAMLQQFPLYLTQKAEPSYLCLLSCYCAGVMPPDLEKKIEKKEKKEIQMAHVPQLMSEAQICLVSEWLGATERYITGQTYSDSEI